MQVLGSFSTIQKAGRQAKAQGQFALMGSLARVVFPILSGLVEEYFEETAAFALVRLCTYAMQATYNTIHIHTVFAPQTVHIYIYYVA